MPGKITLLLFFGLLTATSVLAQKPARDTSITDDLTDAEYEDLFNELDLLLDSLTAPKSFVVFSMGIGKNYFNYQSKSGYELEAASKIAFTPSISYYSKTGLGISGSAVVVNDGVNLNPYQAYFTGSYDYIRNSRFITGVAATHFFRKDSLPFYTSPLKNEIYAYFTYKKFWLKPSVAMSYGWGSRSDYRQSEDYITSLRLALNGFTRVNTRESINDFNLIGSLRHDFYWMGLSGKNDYVRFTPQVVFTSGTQRFGFNQSSSSYATLPRTGANVMYNSGNVHLDDELLFQPLSLSTYLKAEYSRGKFFVQPQVLFDYYFPADEKNFTMAFALTTGVIF